MKPRLRLLLTSIAATCLAFPGQGEPAERLPLLSHTNILDLAGPEYRTPETQVLEVAPGINATYFLLGCGCGRSQSRNVVLYLPLQGKHRVMALPEGHARSLSVDSLGRVHVLWWQTPRSPLCAVTCAPDLDPASCRTAVMEAPEIGNAGRGIWTLRHAGSHIVKLAFDGALSIGERSVLPAEKDSLPGMPLLLSNPTQPEIAYLSRERGTLAIIGPASPSEPLITPLNGAVLERSFEFNRTAMQKLRSEKGAANSRALSIYSATLGSKGQVLAAISPYKPREGALVVQIGRDGTAARTIRCELPRRNDGSGDVIAPAHICVRGDRLLLVSGRGDLMMYGL